MGFFDSAQDVLDKGVSAAKGAVSGVAVEQQAFMKGFVRLCNDGWNQGWHERNGGNLTYRMTPEEVSSCRTFFYDAPSSWVALGVQADDLRGEFFAVTGSGTHLHNVALDPDRNAGIVEINSAGDAWRIVWGLKGGGVPTSEFPSHFLCHAVRKRVTNGANRVVYHAHPTAIGACTLVLPADARVVTRALWKSLTEGVIAFPAGVGVLPWMVPGSSELAQATSRQMGTYEAVVWAQHGLMCAGTDFDATFGLMQAVEKAADVYVRARSMGGGGEPANVISDEGIRATAAAYRLPVNEAFLD